MCMHPPRVVQGNRDRICATFFDRVDKRESEINPRGVVLHVADEVMKAHLSSSLPPHIL